VQLIHEHRGLKTYRDEGTIKQVAHSEDGLELYEINLQGMQRAIWAMTLLAPYGFTPKLIDYDGYYLTMEDMGDTEDVSNYSPDDWQDLRRGLVKCLWTMRHAGVRHGDLNGNNIIVKNKKPYIIDWQEAHIIGTEPPQERPFTDTHFILQDMIRWNKNPDVSDPYRVCRRWAEIYKDLTGGKLGLPLKHRTLLDVGCFQGDFCAFAAAEMMNVMGVDVGTFRSGENSIDIARELWQGMDNIELYQIDVIDWLSRVPHLDFKYDVVLFMDTFPYLVNNHGRNKSTILFQKMVNQAGVVYFETQMHGDKSGIEWLKTDNDVINLYPEAEWHKLAVINECGFPRTLWRVKR